MRLVDKELFDAAEKLYVDGVLRAIGKGADVNARDEDERTALIITSMQDTYDDFTDNLAVDILLYLIEYYKVDVNAKDKYGSTALMYASYKSNKKVAKVLIDHNADVNVKSNDGWTPLMNLALGDYNYDIEIAKLLLDKGANINDTSNGGNTVLHISASWNKYDLVALLLSNGANPNIKNKDGKTAYDIAVEKKYDDIVKLLEKCIL